MIQNFISMNGYVLFVWLSFSIPFLVCALFYYITYTILYKYEKEFAKELILLSKSERILVLEKSKVASQVLPSYNKSI